MHGVQVFGDRSGVAKIYGSVSNPGPQPLGAAITCIVLLLVMPQGSPVKGFAITLLLGVVISLISAIVVTHNLLATVLSLFTWARKPWLLGVQRGRA